MPLSRPKPILKPRDDVRFDELEASISSNLDPVECPIVHYFTKGMYIREMSAPAGSIITSKIHKTQHPFTLSKGKLKVRLDNEEWVMLTAPYTGITQPGTRRVALVIEDCVWTTYHAYRTVTGKENDLSLLEQEKIVDGIEKRIIEKHTNVLILKEKEKQLWHG